MSDEADGGALIAQRKHMSDEPRWKSYIRVAFPKLNYKSASDGVIHFRRGENGILLYALLKEGTWVKPVEVVHQEDTEKPKQTATVKRLYKGKEISL